MDSCLVVWPEQNFIWLLHKEMVLNRPTVNLAIPVVDLHLAIQDDFLIGCARSDRVTLVVIGLPQMAQYTHKLT